MNSHTWGMRLHRRDRSRCWEWITGSRGQDPRADARIAQYAAREPSGPQPVISARAHYDGRPGTTAAARDFTTEVLAGAQATHGLPITARTVEVARLIVSELITNALKHAPGPCLLDLTADGDLQITVWDTSATIPVPQEADAERIGQHGMEIVLMLCRSLDIEPHATGKRVRASLRLP